MSDTEQFVAKLRRSAGRRVRVEIDECWRVFTRLFVDDARAVDARARLAELITEAGRSGLIEPSVSTDNLRPVPLPRFVMLASHRRVKTPPQSVPWVEDLRWAADLVLTPEQRGVLDRVNRWLRDGGQEHPVVPAEERSVELFDDEKAIARRIGGATTLWRPNRLSPELLRFENVPIPFAYRRVGDGSILLMVENTAPFRTCTRLLATESDHPYCAVAFGQGSWAPKTVAAALDLPMAVSEIHYWGDLDVRGLEIAREVLTATRVVGLSARLHESLWALMLEQPPPRATKGPAVFAPSVVEVLPERLRSRATAVLSERRRIPQERVGYELLRNVPRWWDCSIG